MSTDENDRIDDRSAEDVETISTILVEVRDTAGTASKDEVEKMLRSRLDGADVELSDSEVAELVTQVVDGTD